MLSISEWKRECIEYFLSNLLIVLRINNIRKRVSSSLFIFNKTRWIVKVVTIVETRGSLHIYTHLEFNSWNL